MPALLHGREPSQTDLLRRVPAEAGEIAGMRNAVLSYAEARGVTKTLRDDIALAVSEACANVVMHAYIEAAAPGSLTVASTHVNDQLVVAVRDEGRGMLPRPDSPGLGLGLSLIGRLAQRLEIGPQRRVGHRSAHDVRDGHRVAPSWKQGRLIPNRTYRWLEGIVRVMRRRLRAPRAAGPGAFPSQERDPRGVDALPEGPPARGGSVRDQGTPVAG
jgi:serine/threonine-protein kinase RsbW